MAFRVGTAPAAKPERPLRAKSCAYWAALLLFSGPGCRYPPLRRICAPLLGRLSLPAIAFAWQKRPFGRILKPPAYAIGRGRAIWEQRKLGHELAVWRVGRCWHDMDHPKSIMFQPGENAIECIDRHFACAVKSYDALSSFADAQQCVWFASCVAVRPGPASISAYHKLIPRSLR